MLKYETIMMAHIFLRSFAVTTKLSKYLQTSGLDLLTARRLIEQTKTEVKGEMSRDFNTIKVATDTFVHWAREEIVSEEFETAVQKRLLYVQNEFPEKRLDTNPLGTFRIEVFNVIMDTCV